MFKSLLFLFLIAASYPALPQASDFITVKKKNNRTVKTFFPGLYISFDTYDGRHAYGLISAIRNDSIFVKEWDIKTMVTNWGTPIQDTLGVYLNGFNYKEIAKIDVSDNRKGISSLIPPILILGGSGYAVLNVINGAYLTESVTSSKNLKSLSIAAGAAGAGILGNWIMRQKRKYVIEYVRMNEVKKQLRGF